MHRLNRLGDNMTGALNGIRIVDLTTVILGPWATQMLGDMGADVIKVETHHGDTTRHTGERRNPGMASFFMSTNRNKRSVILDLRQDEGREALFKLVGTADVFVHNMRPSIAAKLGLEEERFMQAYPELVFLKTYGFRGDGPAANKPAYDDVIQAASGITDLQTVTSEGGSRDTCRRSWRIRPARSMWCRPCWRRCFTANAPGRARWLRCRCLKVWWIT